MLGGGLRFSDRGRNTPGRGRRTGLSQRLHAGRRGCAFSDRGRKARARGPEGERGPTVVGKRTPQVPGWKRGPTVVGKRTPQVPGWKRGPTVVGKRTPQVPGWKRGPTVVGKRTPQPPGWKRRPTVVGKRTPQPPGWSEGRPWSETHATGDAATDRRTRRAPTAARARSDRSSAQPATPTGTNSRSAYEGCGSSRTALFSGRGPAARQRGRAVSVVEQSADRCESR